MSDDSSGLRNEIMRLVGDYHKIHFDTKPFRAGIDPVPVSGKVFDNSELQNLVDSALDFWLTTGRFAKSFESGLAEEIGVRHARLCNSGSSANLLALSALTSPRLRDRQLQPGDEVITCATGFPTTINPILQNGLVPVFIDVDVPTYNAKEEQLQAAVGPKTKAIMMAHTLGNPFPIRTVMDLAEKHGLWVIEDNCDALGSLYENAPTGSFGDLATLSFYPAHHITTGEGGAVLTNKGSLAKLVESFRDWGRDCWCEPGDQNTCNRRFDWKLGELPCGYDHKYTYSHLGYNLKSTDLQASVGLAQLDKLPSFIAARRYNWSRLRDGLSDMEDIFILPEATFGSNPSWFGFCLSVREESSVSRQAVIRHLEKHKIATRQLFGGNITRQPAYIDRPHRRVGELTNADFVMNNSFWIGVYPGITDEMVDYMLEILHEVKGVQDAGQR